MVDELGGRVKKSKRAEVRQEDIREWGQIEFGGKQLGKSRIEEDPLHLGNNAAERV